MTRFDTPTIDWAALSPELVLLGGRRALPARHALPARTAGGGTSARRRSRAPLRRRGAAAAIALRIADDTGVGIVADALRRDRLAELAQILVVGSGLLTVGVSLPRSATPRRGIGEYYTLLLPAAAGMALLRRGHRT